MNALTTELHFAPEVVSKLSVYVYVCICMCKYACLYECLLHHMYFICGYVGLGTYIRECVCVCVCV